MQRRSVHPEIRDLERVVGIAHRYLAPGSGAGYPSDGRVGGIAVAGADALSFKQGRAGGNDQAAVAVVQVEVGLRKRRVHVELVVNDDVRSLRNTAPEGRIGETDRPGS